MAEIDEFLEGYAPGINDLSQALRAKIKDVVPGCSETLHTGWKVISYGTGKKFCAIAPHAKWVNLQFHNGAALSDPDKLLQGTGKAMRHVKVMPGGVLPVGIVALLKEAAQP